MSSETQERVVILHLSDLHAGQRFEESESGITNRCKRLLEVFNNDTFGPLRLPKVDLLVLSGDLTETGSSEEFQGLMDEFVRPLIQGGLFRSAIAVPGNHDVDWKLVRNPSPPRTPLSEFNTRLLIGYDELKGSKIVSAPTAPTERPVVVKVAGTEWCQVVPFNSVNLGGTLHPDIENYLLLLDPDNLIK